jgi:hypothetical protein
MSSNNFKIQWKPKSINKSFINPLEFEDSSSNKVPLEVTQKTSEESALLLDTLISRDSAVPLPKKRSLEVPSSSAALISKRHRPLTSFAQKGDNFI